MDRLRGGRKGWCPHSSVDENGRIIASVSRMETGSDALTKSINLELSCGFLPPSVGRGRRRRRRCACAQLPYAINSSSFRRYDPRNEEISVAPVKKGTSPPSPPRRPVFRERERERQQQAFWKTVWININAHLKVQWASEHLSCFSFSSLSLSLSPLIHHISSNPRLSWFRSSSPSRTKYVDVRLV